jgi:hypothetical protein
MNIGLISLYLSVGALALYCVAMNPKWLVALLVALMPTDNFNFEGPVTLSLSKLVLIVFVVTLPAQYAVAQDLGRKIRIPASLVLFLLVVTTMTFCAYLRNPRDTVEGFGVLRGPALRPMVQLASLLLQISGLVAVLLWASDAVSWAKLCKLVLLTSTTLAAYGIFQFIGYYFNLPIMTIHRPQEGLREGYALFRLGSFDVFRAGSFAGEPKTAAKFLLVSIVLIVFAKSMGVVRLRCWLTSTLILVLHVVAFILTFSTSSFFGLFLSLPFMFYLFLRCRVRLDRFVKVILSVAIALGLAIAVGGGVRMASEIFEVRVTNRVQTVDNPEQASLELLKEHPQYLMTGIGLGNASFALRSYFDPRYNGPLTVSLSSGYLAVLLEGGLPGLIAFLLFLGGWLHRATRIVVREEPGEHRAMLATTLAVCAVVAAVHAFSATNLQIWFFWGLLVSLCRSRTIRRKFGNRLPANVRFQIAPFPAEQASAATPR